MLTYAYTKAKKASVRNYSPILGIIVAVTLFATVMPFKPPKPTSSAIVTVSRDEDEGEAGEPTPDSGVAGTGGAGKAGTGGAGKAGSGEAGKAGTSVAGTGGAGKAGTGMGGADIASFWLIRKTFKAK